MKKLTKVEIIQDVANHYNLNNRSINGGDCLYNMITPKEERHCAIGRFFLDKIKKKKENVEGWGAIDGLKEYIGFINYLRGLK